MGDSKTSSPPQNFIPLTPPGAAGQHHEIRFRGRTADGREVISQPVLLRAMTGGDDGAVTLGQAHWGHERYKAGETAIASVAATGHEGLHVRFVIEKKKGSDWATVDEVRGVVSNGVASGSWHVPPIPVGGGDASIKAEDIRFRAIADFATATAEPASFSAGTEGELSSPEWSHSHPSNGSAFEHGDEAVMRVAAKDLDGKKVRFIVEQKRGEEWLPYATVTTVVKGGFAVGRVRTHHPVLPPNYQGPPPDEAALKQAAPAQLRFHAELA